MDDEIFPRHYQAWKICITQKCKIELTNKYINQRLDALTAEDSPDRQKFIDKYGKHWTETVIGYFQQAKQEKSI